MQIRHHLDAFKIWNLVPRLKQIISIKNFWLPILFANGSVLRYIIE